MEEMAATPHAIQLFGRVVEQLQRDETILTRCADAVDLPLEELKRLCRRALVRHRAQCRSDKRPRYSAAHLLDVTDTERQFVSIDLLHMPTALDYGHDTTALPEGPWPLHVGVGWLSNDPLTANEVHCLRPEGQELGADDRSKLEAICSTLSSLVNRDGLPCAQLSCTTLELAYCKACTAAGVRRLEIGEDEEMIQASGCRSPHAWIGEVTTIEQAWLVGYLKGEEDALTLAERLGWSPSAAGSRRDAAFFASAALPQGIPAVSPSDTLPGVGPFHVQSSEALGPGSSNAQEVAALGPARKRGKIFDGSGVLRLVFERVAEWTDDAARQVGLSTLVWLFGAAQRALGYPVFFEHMRHLANSRLDTNFLRDDAGICTLEHLVQEAFLPFATTFSRGAEHLDRHCALPLVPILVRSAILLSCRPLCSARSNLWRGVCVVSAHRRAFCCRVQLQVCGDSVFPLRALPSPSLTLARATCRHWYCVECAKKLLQKGEKMCSICRETVFTWRVFTMTVFTKTVHTYTGDEAGKADAAEGAPKDGGHAET